VRTLIVRDKGAQEVVGRENFLDDVLQIAGGENVIQASGWPSIDREQLLALKPDAIIQLLPEAPPHVIEEAQRNWAGLPRIPAVASGRLAILTGWHVQQPGLHLGQLAGEFAEVLHRPATTRPSDGP
jgi:iron complex transport system substrate-binding protein